MSIIITGATGGLGGEVIQHLLNNQTPASEIVAVARDVEKAASIAALGIEVRYGDYENPESLVKAFAGASKLLFISSSNTDDTLRVVQHANVVKAARDAGVPHILYTSYAFAEDSQVSLAQVHLATEHAIQTTNIPYTFLRNSLYAEVFVNPGLGASIAQGALVTNTGTGTLNVVTRNDLAKATAVVLAGVGHENQSYNLVSNQPWSFDELAGIVSDVTGTTVVHQSVTFEEQKSILLSVGLPEPVAQLFASIYQAIADGETARISDDLQKLIGSFTPLKDIVAQALKG